MKIQQQEAEFKPITITLETKLEIDSFLNLIDYTTHNSITELCKNSYELARNIANEYSNMGFSD